jgi:hypothetical protein
VNDNKEGKGVYTFSNGDQYKGEYYDNRRHGKGIYNYANGGVYEGEYKDGIKDGKGLVLVKLRDLYVCRW